MPEALELSWPFHLQPAPAGFENFWSVNMRTTWSLRNACVHASLNLDSQQACSCASSNLVIHPVGSVRPLQILGFPPAVVA